MLIIEHLTIQYNKSSIPVKDVSFVLKKGEIGCVLGLSGIGKTTLLKAIGGVIKPTSGSITLNHCPLTPDSHLIGYVSQEYGLYPWKNAKTNITLLNKIHNKPFSSDFFNEIICSLNLQDILKKHPNTLSGGQKQRIALARVFLFNPDIMLLDEPFSSLDEITRNAAQDLFLMLWRKYKPTTLLVTHSIDEALKLGHSIFILKNGIMDRIANPNIDSENAVKKESIKKYIVEKLNIGKESLL